jgi:Phytanoyl-CoA dioxygenase (PhyH)/SEC-C motif
MDWIVAVSAAEIANGALSSDSERDAHAAFREHGCILLRGAFPRSAVEAMFSEYTSRYGSLNSQGMQEESDKPPPNRFLRVGDARYEITLRVSGAFAALDVIANRLSCRFLNTLLGDDMLLSGFTAVVSYPGATQQHIHRDYRHLFFEPAVGPGLPVYAVNVAVPLIDVDLETGPTGIWLGSHRWAPNVVPQRQAMTVCPFQRGDCILLDYRTFHTGLPNLSGRARPIVYMVYTRPWFFDEVNHVNRISLDMPLEQYDQLPQSVRPLLTRAFSQATRARWHEADARGRAPLRDTNDPSTWGKLGRNDPCGCGSGKKYKQCHGRPA